LEDGIAQRLSFWAVSFDGDTPWLLGSRSVYHTQLHTVAMPDLEERVLAFIAQNQRGIEADAVRSALAQETGVTLTQDDFDQLVLRLNQLGRVAEDRITSPNRRILRIRTSVEWRLPTELRNERDLEPHVEGFLWRRFPERFLDFDLRNYSLIVQNTAHGGIPAGLWTRPDLAAAVVTRYTYAPVPQLDLYGFELKMAAGCTVYAVHEALAHTTFVNFAYLVIFLPDPTHSERENLRRMMEQAQKHGVGIVIVKDPVNDESYDVVLAAQRQSPKRKRIDDFISQRFDRANQLALRTWVRQ
jgi:hypothetical protein